MKNKIMLPKILTLFLFVSLLKIFIVTTSSVKKEKIRENNNFFLCFVKTKNDNDDNGLNYFEKNKNFAS